MKLSERIKQIREEKGDKAEYQKFFKKTLKKYGVDEPDKLKGDDKKKFYDEIDAGWKGDDEVKESLDEEKVAGWIAFYNNKKLEIEIDKDAKDLYSAKQFAIKHFKVPKSKQGLLAIQVAY